MNRKKTHTALLNVLLIVSLLTSLAFAVPADPSTKTNAQLAEQIARNAPDATKRGPLSYPKGKGVRMVSTGHSWVAPALRKLPAIAKAAGFDAHRQRSHIRGGARGAANAIWLAEIGRANANAKPSPVLIPAIATGQWDIMTWGVYLNDKPEYFEQWIEFCLKYNPEMTFYLQDAWTGTTLLRGDKKLTLENFIQAQAAINAKIADLIEALNKKFPAKVRVIPVGNSMIELLKLYYAGSLPGIEGISKHLSGKEYTLWSDGGHLGKHMAWWEGYVYYATIYKKSPELIEAQFEVTKYDKELDKILRQSAWKAVTNHPHTGLTDKNDNRIADQIENKPDKK